MAEAKFDFVRALNYLDEGEKIRPIVWTDKDHYIVKNKASGLLIEVKGDKVKNYKFDNISNISEEVWSKYYDNERRKVFDEYTTSLHSMIREAFKYKVNDDGVKVSEALNKISNIYRESQQGVLFKSDENTDAAELEKVWMEKLAGEVTLEYFARAWNNNMTDLNWHDLYTAEDVVFNDWSKICEELKTSK